jgi:ketosteroid isomerase-like protein
MANDQADVDAIIRVKHRYGEVVDGLIGGEWSVEHFSEVFTEDATLQFAPAPAIRGLADIRAMFDQMRQGQSQMWHSFMTPIIDLNGDVACGRWTVLAFTTGIEAGATAGTTYGRYADRYRRTPAGWRISEQIFRR